MSFNIEQFMSSNDSGSDFDYDFSLYRGLPIAKRPILAEHDLTEFVWLLSEFYESCVDEQIDFWTEYKVRLGCLYGFVCSPNRFLRTAKIIAHQYDDGDIIETIESTFLYPAVQFLVLEDQPDVDLWFGLQQHYNYYNNYMEDDTEVRTYRQLETTYGISSMLPEEAYNDFYSDNFFVADVGVEKYQITRMMVAPNNVMWGTIFHSDIADQENTPYLNLGTPIRRHF